ncbi:MAG: A/G-specific adenine glycosylase, partial [Candidatus Saccharimonadales bacterium]
MNETDFIDVVWQRGRELRRDMPWRDDTRPYYVLVSELMLQQTQVDRVIPKFSAFIECFPDIVSLAGASLADVLTMWSGLVYNRRARYLHDAARMIAADCGGQFPTDYDGLVALPGVGPNTAGAILNYAFNTPTVFIETNVRTVYFHHFFPDGDIVHDNELRPLIERTIDRDYPREFYWALMDYGSWLKRQGVGRIRQSQHYKKQAPLKGSLREVRGHIVRHLTQQDATAGQLQSLYPDDKRVPIAVDGLVRDGLVQQRGDLLHLTK